MCLQVRHKITLLGFSMQYREQVPCNSPNLWRESIPWPLALIALWHDSFICTTWYSISCFAEVHSIYSLNISLNTSRIM